MLLKKENLFMNQILDINSITEKYKDIKIELDFEEYEAKFYYECVGVRNCGKVIKIIKYIEVKDYINIGQSESNNLIFNGGKHSCIINGNMLERIERYK